MPLFPACTIGNTMLIGVDAHSTALPPVPLSPHPYVGPLMLWTTPKFPMANTMVSYVPTCCVGAKGYSVHIPQGTWVDIPKVSFKVWYLTNLLTVGIVTVFSILANIQLAIVQGMLTSFVKPTDAAFKETWTKICAQFAPFTSWQTWAQLLIPPLPLPGAEGNAAIGSPTVSVNGGSMALGVPLGGASCSEIPIVPNASIITFSNVMVGMTFAQLVEQFFNNAVQGAINYAGSRVASGFIDRNRCRLGLEPIDLVSGANFEDKVDFELPGAMPIKWKRYYASSLDTDGNLGWNWSHEYSHWLEFGSRQITYHNHQNRSIAFPHLKLDGESHYLPFDRLTLVRMSEKSWLIRTIDGRTFCFSKESGDGYAWVRRIETRSGDSIVFRYDPKGFLHEIVCPAERRLRISTDEKGRILRVVLHGPSGRESSLVAYRYDARGDLVEVTDADSKRSTYAYDDDHWMTRKTDRRGYSFHYEYDHNGRCIRSRGDDDLYAGEVEYIPPVQTTILTAPSGGKYIYRYNDHMLVTSILDPCGGVQIFEYDDDGNLVAEVDENGFATKYAYDEFGNVVEETNPFGGSTKRSFNEQNLKVEEVDPDGNTTTWAYDERGNLLAVTHPTGAGEAYEYDASNRLIRHADRDGTEFRFTYNRIGHLRAKTDATGLPLEEYRYDDAGRRTEVVVGGQRTVTHFDAMGRVARTEFPDGSAEAAQYDAEGNRLRLQDGRGRQWRFEYTSWNKLVAITNPVGARTQFGYTRADELNEITDPNGQKTTFIFDQKDRIIESQWNGRLVSRSMYDQGRNATALHDARASLLVQRSFGPMRKKVGRDHGPGTTVAYEYDQCARIVSAICGDHSIERVYAPDGSIVSESVDDDVIAFTRDAEGRSTCVEFGSGQQATLEWHEENNSITITDPVGGVHKLYRRNTSVETHEWPNGLRECRFYLSGGLKGRHHLTRYETQGPQRLIERETLYDSEGTPLRLSDHRQRDFRSFEYDAAGRLAAMKGGEPEETYKPDPGGNVSPGQDTRFEFGDQNQLVKAGDDTFEYDALGRQMAKATKQGRWRFNHDTLGRLVSVVGPDGARTEFTYDPLDRLLSLQTGQLTVRFQWFGHRLIRERHDDDYERLYVWLFDDDPAPWMMIDRTRDGDSNWKEDVFYLHADRLGVVREITDKNGAVVWEARISPYGRAEVSAASRIEFNLRLPGQYWVESAMVSYNGRRFYDPAIARFIEPDPVGLRESYNRYAYPSNPLRDTDVTGLAEDCTSSRPPSDDDDFDNAPTQVFRRPANPELTEACGPAQMPWMVRPGEGTRPASARDAFPGRPMHLDPNESHTYMYVVHPDGTVTYAPQVRTPDGRETVKHTDLTEAGPARVSGEINYDPNTGVWLMDDNSGRYSAAPDDNNQIRPNRSVQNTEAARDLIYESGTDPNTTTIVPVPGIGGR